MTLPDYYIDRQRDFPRFHRSKRPRCPLHGAMRLGEKVRMAKATISTGVRPIPGAERKIYRCKNPKCHFVASSDEMKLSDATRLAYSIVERYGDDT